MTTCSAACCGRKATTAPAVAGARYCTSKPASISRAASVVKNFSASSMGQVMLGGPGPAQGGRQHRLHDRGPAQFGDKQSPRAPEPGRSPRSTRSARPMAARSDRPWRAGGTAVATWCRRRSDRPRPAAASPPSNAANDSPAAARVDQRVRARHPVPDRRVDPGIEAVGDERAATPGQAARSARPTRPAAWPRPARRTRRSPRLEGPAPLGLRRVAPAAEPRQDPPAASSVAQSRGLAVLTRSWSAAGHDRHRTSDPATRQL